MLKSNAVWRAGTGGLRILELEDSAADAELILDRLEADGLHCHVTRVADQSTFQQILAVEPFDVILCDHSIPGGDALDAVKFARQTRPDIPVIMLSGLTRPGEKEEAFRLGAADWILKSEMEKLAPGVHRALGHVRDPGAKTDAIDATFSESSDAPTALLDLASDALVIWKPGGQITFWSHAAERLLGWSRKDALGKSLPAVLSAEETAWKAALKTLLETGSWRGTLQIQNPTGHRKDFSGHWKLLKGSAEPVLVLSSFVSAGGGAFESLLLRAQRANSLGSLLSDAAYDLNNSLGPVSMTVELLRHATDPKARAEYLDITASGVERAAHLIKQIVALTRASSESDESVPLEKIISEIVSTMREIFPSAIEIHFVRPRAALWRISANATDVRQALLNLCVNARDAMPGGGRLELTAHNITLAAPAAASLGAAAGAYVRLTVADTGAGIPAEILPHIFEPFFTTKLPGEAPGLGLSVVRHIVEHSGGALDLQTQPDKGTSVSLFFPAAA